MSQPAPQAAQGATVATRGSAWKIVVSVLVVTGAVVLLLRQTLKEGSEHYKHVDEVVKAPDALRGKRIQVHGNVVPGSIEQEKNTLHYRFKIETGAMSRPNPRPVAVIAADYTGIVPDTFKSSAEVVVTGMLTPENNINVAPDGIMAKCPSKYDAEKPSALKGSAATADLR